jgi:hypothetical protein
MKNHFKTLVAAGLSAALQVTAASDISGTITLTGTPPPETPIPQLKNDPSCSELHPGPAQTRFYVVGPKGELADVLVTLKGMDGKSTGATAPPVVLDQRGCEYVPYVLAIQTQQKLLVKNSDPVLHNVNSTPLAPGNPTENKAQMPGGPDLTFTFPTAEIFLRFKCDVHAWMFAYVCVVDHPYFAVSDPAGKYTIKHVPDGKYTLEVYHRKAAPATTPVTKEIEVKGGDITANFTLEAKAK